MGEGVLVFLAGPVGIESAGPRQQGFLGRAILDAGVRTHLREVRQFLERDAGGEESAEQVRRRRLLSQRLAIPVARDGDVGEEVDFAEVEAVRVDDPAFLKLFDPERCSAGKEVVTDHPKAHDPGRELLGREEAALGLRGVEEDDVPRLELGPLAQQPWVISESPST